MASEWTSARGLGADMNFRMRRIRGESNARRGRSGSVLVLTLVALSVAFAACGGDDQGNDGSVNPPSGGPTSAIGPGISVAEALENSSGQPLLVNGFIVVTGGRTRLCEALLESFPPQCGGPRLDVQNLDLATIDDLMMGTLDSQAVSWTDQQIQLLGTVSDGVLSVSGTARG